MGGFWTRLTSSDEAEENADYDPHEYRTVNKPTNYIETLVHLLKCSLGTGILAMPQGFSNSGMYTGIIATIIVGFITTHCLHLLVKSQYKACRRTRQPLVSYPETLKTAIKAGSPKCQWFARPGAIMVDIFLVFYQLGICCCYIVFIGSNLKQLVDPTYVMSIEIWIAIIFIPVIAINLIPNLKFLAPFTAVANVLTLIGLIIIMYYLASGKKSYDEVSKWGNWTTFPLFFGTVMFALTSPGVVVAIENNMKKPKSFGGWFGMLNIAMFIIVALYTAIGVLGYQFCVSSCSDTITLDLPEGPASMTVMCFMVIAVFISYALHCYVPVEVVWSGYLMPWLEKKGRTGHLMCWNSLLRIVLCILTFILAVLIPRLGLFISLFGAFCLSALGIIFPAMMQVCYAYKRSNMGLIVAKDIFLIIFGLVGLVAGTYTALVAMVKSFSDTPPPTTTPAYFV